MKKQMYSVITVILALLLIVSAASCGKASDTDALWENAAYSEDMTFGTGAKTVKVEVKVGENAVTFTIHTDKDTVGAAMVEHGLLTGEEGPYGLYVKAVNGMTADYDVDQSYWSFNINGEYAMTGVDQTNIEEGATYQLVYTK